MNPFSENKHFFIRKYKTQGNKPLLHRHSYIQINYVYKGSGYHIVNNRKIEISKGDIFIIPPFVPHSIVGEEHRGLEIFEFEFVISIINFAKSKIVRSDGLPKFTGPINFCGLLPICFSCRS